jgi:hypothetical protein
VSGGDVTINGGRNDLSRGGDLKIVGGASEFVTGDILVSTAAVSNQSGEVNIATSSGNLQSGDIKVMSGDGNEDVGSVTIMAGSSLKSGSIFATAGGHKVQLIGSNQVELNTKDDSMGMGISGTIKLSTGGALFSNSGNVDVLSGRASSGRAGSLRIESGPIIQGSSSSVAGKIEVSAGMSSNQKKGGSVNIEGGNSPMRGGDIVFRAASSNGFGSVHGFVVESGSSKYGSGGGLILRGGNAEMEAGNISISSGFGLKGGDIGVSLFGETSAAQFLSSSESSAGFILSSSHVRYSGASVELFTFSPTTSGDISFSSSRDFNFHGGFGGGGSVVLSSGGNSGSGFIEIESAASIFINSQSMDTDLTGTIVMTSGSSSFNSGFINLQSGESLKVSSGDAILSSGRALRNSGNILFNSGKSEESHSGDIVTQSGDGYDGGLFQFRAGPGTNTGGVVTFYGGDSLDRHGQMSFN